jgi:hypothetical protein
MRYGGRYALLTSSGYGLSAHPRAVARVDARDVSTDTIASRPWTRAKGAHLVHGGSPSTFD